MSEDANKPDLADIFFSYKQEDRAKVEPLVRALEAAGFTVWWDPAIAPGQRFAVADKAALDEASCVIVGWSRQSVDSHWVLDVAASGRDRGILVPVMLDGTTPPLGFRQLQTADLSSWAGDADDARFGSILAGVTRLVGERAKATSAPMSASAVEREVRIDWVGQIRYTLLMLVAIVAVLVLMRYLGLRG